jgi:hypothetical protein
VKKKIVNSNPKIASGLRPWVRDSAEPVFHCRPAIGGVAAK